MADYLVYHKPEFMGYDAVSIKTLCAYTKKNPGDAVRMSRLWLLTGSGRPRKF